MKIDLTEHETQSAIEAIMQSRNRLRREGFQGITEQTLTSIIEKMERTLAAERQQK